jgi:D-alanine-D-alanine ligase
MPSTVEPELGTLARKARSRNFRLVQSLPGAAERASRIRQEPARRTFGPVADLERHVDARWWREIFDELYLKTDGDVFENAENTKADIDAVIAGVDLRREHRVLDLCCGQGRHVIELARRGYRDVSGIDCSPYLLGLARERARASGVEIAFHEGDARHCALDDRQFDCVMILGNSFGYFDAIADDVALLRRARLLLRPGGRLALDLVDGDWLREHFEQRSWEWLDGDLVVCRERSLSKDRERLITREIVMSAERGVIADRFFAERLYSRVAIVKLLESIGFRQVGFRRASESRSDRGGDLGMMAQRLLVTGSTAIEQPAPARRPRSVGVVMGDPRLADPVKPGGGFGAAELETIAKLREALSTLPSYRFRYLDDHANLALQLQRASPELVLNLCDEGYKNDAAMEAHIPALLEVLDIPFTGAGPGCLTLCYDKALVRSLAATIGIPVPDEAVIAADDPLIAVPPLFPALIKPCLGDNSVGIDERSVVRTPEAAIEVLRRLQRLLPGRPLLMQEFLDGPEYSVGVIGNPEGDFALLPILEVDYTRLDPRLPPILAYASKFDTSSPYSRQIAYRRASLPEAVERRLAEQVKKLFFRVGCRDYARFDFRTARNGEIKLLEVNPNPGWCWDGKLNLMAGFAGLSYAELLRRIIDAAERRIAGAGTAAARRSAGSSP